MMLVRNSGSCLLPAIHLQLGGEADVVWRQHRSLQDRAGSLLQKLHPRRSDEPGILQELDEDLVDELVLRDGLDHEHPLLPEEPQHRGHLHLFIML